MRNYIAPLKDMKFVLKDLLDVEQKYQGMQNLKTKSLWILWSNI